MKKKAALKTLAEIVVSVNRIKNNRNRMTVSEIVAWDHVERLAQGMINEIKKGDGNVKKSADDGAPKVDAGDTTDKVKV